MLLTLGAGDVDCAGARRLGGRVTPPAGVERDYPLARLTTVRTGGSADWFARPGDLEGPASCCAWAERGGSR